MDTLAALSVGICLSAACGLRVFIPMLALSLGARLGLVTPGAGWEWIGTWSACSGFALAAGLEIAGYYVPWLDHLLDTIATPLAVVTGGIAAAASLSGVGELAPSITSASAIIGGGATAGAVQLSTVGVRAASGGMTGGVLNPLVSTVENVMSVVVSVLAIVVPVLAGLLLVGVAVLLMRAWSRRAGTVVPMA